MLKSFSALPFAAALLIAGPLQALAQQAPPPPTPQPPQWYWGPGPGHMWGDGYGWHFWWMPPVMMLFMLLVFGAVFYFMLGHRPGHHVGPPWERGGRSATHSALQILNERFARGEIQKDEYAEKKAAILSGG